jgi:hypothetical protein
VTDLRTIALILNEGRKKAGEMDDAPLTAALSAMMETAIGYHLATEPDAQGYNRQPRPDDTWNVSRDFAVLSEPYR